MTVEQLFILLSSEPFRVLMASRGIRVAEVARMAARRATGVYVRGATPADDLEIVLHDNEIEDGLTPIDVVNRIEGEVADGKVKR